MLRVIHVEGARGPHVTWAGYHGSLQPGESCTDTHTECDGDGTESTPSFPAQHAGRSRSTRSMRSTRLTRSTRITRSTPSLEHAPAGVWLFSPNERAYFDDTH